jgi:hypothetical protein
MYNTNIAKIRTLESSQQKIWKIAHENKKQTGSRVGKSLPVRIATEPSPNPKLFRRKDVRRFYQQQKENQPEQPLLSREFQLKYSIGSRKTSIVKHTIDLRKSSLNKSELPTVVRGFDQSHSDTQNTLADDESHISKRVKLRFSNNPIYSKFKLETSGNLPQLRSFKESMVQVIREIDGLHKDHKVVSSQVMNTFSKLRRVRDSSMSVLKKKMSATIDKSIFIE